MKLVISPAKSLDFIRSLPTESNSKACFLKEAESLNNILSLNNVLSHNTIEITELPVGRWTEDYKETLNKMIIERSGKNEGKVSWS